MAILNSKLFIALLVIILVLAVLFIIGKKSVQAEIQIEATQEEVWSVLTDFSTVKDWNTVLIPIEGKLGEGNTIKYEFYQEVNGKAAVMDAKVKQLVPNQLINQGGGITGVLTFDHHYVITQQGKVTTVKINEHYRGIMVLFWDPAPVEKAYERLLQLLKERVLKNG